MPQQEHSQQVDGSFDAARECRVAWRLAALVLAVLTLVKPLGGIPHVGAIAFTVAAGLQLYLPLWRADRLGRGLDFVGLHFGTWKRDLRLCVLLCIVFFPPYVLVYHLFMVHGHAGLEALGLPWMARYVPRMALAPMLPTTAAAWWAGSLWLGETALTHTFGVALPEETFYRGYLQPRLECRWPPRRRVLGATLGTAAVAAAALFALGHFLGEWNPLRLGPFFPALVFAWQRNATGSVFGAIAFHASCNILGELLFTLYRPL